MLNTINSMVLRILSLTIIVISIVVNFSLAVFGVFDPGYVLSLYTEHNNVVIETLSFPFIWMHAIYCIICVFSLLEKNIEKYKSIYLIFSLIILSQYIFLFGYSAEGYRDGVFINNLFCFFAISLRYGWLTYSSCVELSTRK